MSEKQTPGQSGHLFEFFQKPVLDDDYYVFTLKPDHELPDGVTRADFCDSTASPTGFAVPVSEEDERAAKRLKGGLH